MSTMVRSITRYMARVRGRLRFFIKRTIDTRFTVTIATARHDMEYSEPRDALG